MFFIILIELLMCVLITYFWTWISHMYIMISQGNAASSFPGDITFTQKIIYQLFFPVSLFFILFLLILPLSLLFKNKIPKKRILYIIPVICTIYILIDIYIFLFIK